MYSQKCTFDLPGSGNTFMFNDGDGVYVASDSVAIQGNAINANGGLGIDLAPDGITANDSGDPDTGANNLQDFPVLTSAVTTPTDTTLGGALNNAASTTYRLEFFAGPNCDASGNGEGKTYLGFTNVTTNGSGDATFSITLPVGAGSGVATATATDPAGNTSEFSACLTLMSSGPTDETHNWHHTYDGLGRLIISCEGWDGDCGAPAIPFTYNYDGAGNLTRFASAP